MCVSGFKISPGWFHCRNTVRQERIEITNTDDVGEGLYTLFARSWMHCDRAGFSLHMWMLESGHWPAVIDNRWNFAPTESTAVMLGLYFIWNIKNEKPAQNSRAQSSYVLPPGFSCINRRRFHWLHSKYPIVWSGVVCQLGLTVYCDPDYSYEACGHVCLLCCVHYMEVEKNKYVTYIDRTCWYIVPLKYFNLFHSYMDLFQ